MQITSEQLNRIIEGLCMSEFYLIECDSTDEERRQVESAIAAIREVIDNYENQNI